MESRPVWACRLIEAYLQRSYALAKQSGSSNPFPSMYSSSTTGKDVLLKAARVAPQDFAELLLPFLTTVLENNVDKRLGLPWGDIIWGYNISDSIVGLDDSFLAGMEAALRWLALNEPDDFREYATDLRESEYLIHQYLLIRSYAANGQRYPDEAVEYMVEDFSVRLATDYASTSSETPNSPASPRGHSLLLYGQAASVGTADFWPLSRVGEGQGRKTDKGGVPNGSAGEH